MAEPEHKITDRVAERLEMANREFAKIIGEAQGDSIAQLQAALNAHVLYIRTLSTLTGELAAEIDRLRHQSAPPG